MRVAISSLLLSLAACGSRDDQPAVVTNILDETTPRSVPVPQAESPPDNAIVPVEPVPAIKSPPADTPGLIPTAVQGRWTGEADACGDRAADLELTITPASLIFHESVGTVTGAEAGAGGRLKLAASFTGEGANWTRTLDLRPSPDGQRLTIVNDGAAVTRKRCD